MRRAVTPMPLHSVLGCCPNTGLHDLFGNERDGEERHLHLTHATTNRVRYDTRSTAQIAHVLIGIYDGQLGFANCMHVIMTVPMQFL